MGRLSGKVAIITGGASGIGRGAVETFVSEGACVVIADVQDDKGERLAQTLGASTRYVRADVGVERDVNASAMPSSSLVPADLESDVVALPAWYPGRQPPPELTLTKTEPEPSDPLSNSPDMVSALKLVDFRSPVLCKFWGQETHMKAWVLLPPGYGSHARERYPTVYFTHGFGGNFAGIRARFAPTLYHRMKSGEMPEMIWVLLDESSPTGTHESIDGLNNGPWGTALIQNSFLTWKAITDGRAGFRAVLQGHSSGRLGDALVADGLPENVWWHMVHLSGPERLPRFGTIDLYAANANMYRRPDGSAQPMIRMHDAVLAPWNSWRTWRRCWETTAGRLRPSSGSSPHAARTGGRCPCLTVPRGQWIPR